MLGTRGCKDSKWSPRAFANIASYSAVDALVVWVSKKRSKDLWEGIVFHIPTASLLFSAKLPVAQSRSLDLFPLYSMFLCLILSSNLGNPMSRLGSIFKIVHCLQLVYFLLGIPRN